MVLQLIHIIWLYIGFYRPGKSFLKSLVLRQYTHLDIAFDFSYDRMNDS